MVMVRLEPHRSRVEVIGPRCDQALAQPSYRCAAVVVSLSIRFSCATRAPLNREYVAVAHDRLDVQLVVLREPITTGAEHLRDCRASAHPETDAHRLERSVLGEERRCPLAVMCGDRGDDFVDPLCVRHDALS